MKKIILASLAVFALIFASAPVLAASPAAAAKPEKAIIIYFDYSENINTEGLDIDAVSQASIAEPERVRDRSNVLVMADMLKERTGAEVYALHITEPYAPKFEDMVDGAQTDKNENRPFSFAEPLPDFQDIDTIYFLSPIWWYTMPQPVRSFFQQVDLSGKQLAYFSINRGSSNGNILNEIAEYQPDTDIFAEHTLSAMIDNDAAEKEFSEYLDTQNWLSK